MRGGCTFVLQDGNELGGSFRLTFHGQTTSSISYSAAAYQVQQALEDLTEIGGVSVARCVTVPDIQRHLELTGPQERTIHNEYTGALMVPCGCAMVCVQVGPG